MIGPPGNVRVYLACGVTDMRRGIDGLSTLAEGVIGEAPGSGAIFGFRGRRAARIKLLWWDGQGFCLFYKVLEKGHFPWPAASTRRLVKTRSPDAHLGSILCSRRMFTVSHVLDDRSALSGIVHVQRRAGGAKERLRRMANPQESERNTKLQAVCGSFRDR